MTFWSIALPEIKKLIVTFIFIYHYDISPYKGKRTRMTCQRITLFVEEDGKEKMPTGLDEPNFDLLALLNLAFCHSWPILSNQIKQILLAFCFVACMKLTLASREE